MIEWADELIKNLFFYGLGLVGSFATLSMLIAVLKEWSGEEGAIAKAFQKMAVGIIVLILTPTIVAILTWIGKKIAVVKLGW
jgi:hypothetical protein